MSENLQNIDPSKSANDPNVNDDGNIFKAVDLQFKPNSDLSSPEILDDISDIFTSPPDVNQQPTDKPADSKGDDDLAKKLEETERKYSESSKEAISLATEKKQYQPFIPLLEKMRSDPKLVEYVDGYLKTGQFPQSVADELQLPDDFKYDGDKAIKEPDSLDAKILYKVIDRAIGSRFDEFAKEQNMSMRRMSDENKFKADMKMSDDDWKNYAKYADNKIKTLTYEDMYYLWKREDREKEIATNANKAAVDQFNRARELSYPTGQGVPPTIDVNQEKEWYKSLMGGLLPEGNDLKITR